MYAQPGFDQNSWQQSQQPQTVQAPVVDDQDEVDQSHRPPNAFILYSQAMRSEARQQNPSLSNTEVSRILGRMWKEVPNEVKLQYKQKAAKLQEEFKKLHPDYTYRKARRKRALNELLTKSAQGYPMAGYPGADHMMVMGGVPMMAGQQAYQAMMPGQQPMMGMMPTQMGAMPGMMQGRI